MNRSLVQQLMRFGVVGILATLMHAVAFHLLHTRYNFSSIPANLISFALAFALSYLGHLKWTFAPTATPAVKQGRPAQQKQTLSRFLATALLGLSVNMLAGWLIVDYAQLSHYYFLAVVIFCTPALTFILSKYWAFR